MGKKHVVIMMQEKVGSLIARVFAKGTTAIISISVLKMVVPVNSSTVLCNESRLRVRMIIGKNFETWLACIKEFQLQSVLTCRLFLISVGVLTMKIVKKALMEPGIAICTKSLMVWKIANG